MNMMQFQKLLRNRNIDGPLAVVLTEMYEKQLETVTQLDACMKLLVEVTDSLQNVVGLHEHLKSGIDDTRKRLGIDETVQSETLTSENDYKN